MGGSRMRRAGVIILSILLVMSGMLFQVDKIELVKGNDVPIRGFDDWTMDMNVSEASEASFIGENAYDYSGSVSSAGDVNGDGYDDILIGAPFNKEGGYLAGQTYLIFGKAAGWAIDFNLSNANASFIGETTQDTSGIVSGAGDVNGDGYDDILIGANVNDEGGDGAGQTYLIFGKEEGWSMDSWSAASRISSPFRCGFSSGMASSQALQRSATASTTTATIWWTTAWR